MSDFQAGNARKEWIANRRGIIFDAAGAGAREWLERFLPPLRGNHAEMLVEKADGDREEFAAALNSVVLDYEIALRDMFAATPDPRALLAEMRVCEWCDQQPCADPDQHDLLRRQSEVEHWRKASAAGAVGVGPLSALGTGQSAAAERAADAGTSAAHLTPAGGSHPPSTTAGRGAASVKGAEAAPAGDEARGMDWPTDSTGEWACICGPHDPPGSCPGCPEYAPRGRSL